MLSPEQNGRGKAMLLRIVSMLTKLGRRNHELHEKPAVYGDYDNDHEEDRESQPMGAG